VPSREKGPPSEPNRSGSIIAFSRASFSQSAELERGVKGLVRR
jgi:hypothetical protein